MLGTLGGLWVMGHRGAPGKLSSSLSLQGNRPQILKKKDRSATSLVIDIFIGIKSLTLNPVFWHLVFQKHLKLQSRGAQYLPVSPAATHQKK